MNLSLDKIAKELGVSKSTVSFALSGQAREKRISEEVENRVKEFCASVNYVPNIHAQRVNRNHSGNIGFLVKQDIVVDFNNPFDDNNINRILGGMVSASEKLGYRVSIQLYTEDMAESRVYNWLRNHEIDGLVYYGLDMPEKWKKTFDEECRHIVGIGIEPEGNILSVNIDNFEMSAKLTKYLIDSGRRKFMYLSGIDNTFVSDERKRGFLSTLKENGIEFDEEIIINAKFSELIAERMVKERYKDADALVCANDGMAIGALRALKSLNIDVPDKVAVAGGDNIFISRYFVPSLTTFDNMQNELGVTAAKTLIKMIEGKKAKSVVLNSDIVIREST